MPLVFKYFAVIAAVVSLVNLVLVERRVAAAGGASDALSRRVVRVYFGMLIAYFLILFALQLAGGYADPLFPFYERTRTVPALLAWLLTYTLWSAALVGIWRPGVAEAVARLGLVRVPARSATSVRALVTLALLVNGVVFGLLLAGVFGPIPRPQF